MNKEVIKAMQGKKEHKAHKWWRKNGYKVWRVVLFPLWIGEILTNKCREYINSRQKECEEWDEERANEILNYYIPRRAKWIEEEQSFYFFDNGMGWGLKYAKKYLKRKDRRFWKVHCGWWGGKIRTFLINKFELEGFVKDVGVCDEGWTEVSFFRKA